MAAATITSKYEMPMNSAMMKAAAPMMGGITWPFVEAATSIAPALTAGMPILRMTGMVNVPVVTTFAIDEPEIMPVMPEARIAALAGPPLNLPTRAKERARKYCPAPALSRRAPNSTNREHEAHRDADRNAEDRLPGQPLVTDQPVEAQPLVGHDVRHRLAEDRVDEEYRADDDERNADRPAGGVEEQQNADPAEDRFDRNAVPDVEHPLARDEAAPADEEIERGARAEEGEGEVVEGNPP